MQRNRDVKRGATGWAHTARSRTADVTPRLDHAAALDCDVGCEKKEPAELEGSPRGSLSPALPGAVDVPFVHGLNQRGRIALTTREKIRKPGHDAEAGARVRERLQDADMPSNRGIGRRGHIVILARPPAFGKHEKTFAVTSAERVHSPHVCHGTVITYVDCPLAPAH